MSELELALDDIDGLHEAYFSLGDEQRRHALARDADASRRLQREIAAAADAYVSALMASSRGELDAMRLKRCREAALAAMPNARKNRKELAALVEERRLPSGDERGDLEQLLTLSLHSRAALAAFEPTVDRRAAAGIGNKMLIELRDATLRYMAASRDAADGDTRKPRAAAAELLRKSEAHAVALYGLAPDPDPVQGEASLGASLSRDVVDEVRHAATGWEPHG